MGYFKNALKGVTWMTAFRVVYRLIGIIRLSIIAHILSPHDLGVFGIATISLGFLEIVTETGINVFLIQEKKTNKYINSAWVVSIIRGILISLIIVLTAGNTSTFFNSPETRSLLYLVALVPLIRGFINPSIVKFQKYLFFNKEFFYRASVYFVESIFSISGAIILKNPLGLVLGFIGGAIYELIFTFIAVKPLPRFIIEFERIRKVIRRGIWVTLFGIFDYIYTQADNIVVGRLLGVSSLGIYQNAYKVSTLPLSEVGDIFFRVTFPVFSKFPDESDRLKRAFLKTVLVNTILTSGVTIFVFASSLVKLLFGSGWEAAVPVIKILSVLGIVRGIIGSTGSLLVAKRKQKYAAIAMVISAAGLLVTIIPLTIKFGIMGAGISAIIGIFSSVPFVIFYVNKTLNAKN